MRPKVPTHRIGADCSVVVMKRGNARGANGAGHRHWIGSTGNGRSPIISGRRQPSCDDTSRMNRKVPVRICERLGAKFLGRLANNRHHGQSSGIFFAAQKSQHVTCASRRLTIKIKRTAARRAILASALALMDVCHCSEVVAGKFRPLRLLSPWRDSIRLPCPS